MICFRESLNRQPTLYLPKNHCAVFPKTKSPLRLGEAGCKNSYYLQQLRERCYMLIQAAFYMGRLVAMNNPFRGKAIQIAFYLV